MKGRLLISVTLLTGIILPVSRLAAQIDSLKERKNIVELFQSLNYSMNGVNPFFLMLVSTILLITWLHLMPWEEALL